MDQQPDMPEIQPAAAAGEGGRHRGSLKNKMTIWVSLLVAVIMVISGSIAYTYFRAEFSRTVLREQQLLVTDIARNIDDSLDARLRLVQNMADLLSHDVGKSLAVTSALLSREEHGALFFDRLLLMDPGGRLIASVPDGVGTADFAAVPALAQVARDGKAGIFAPARLPGGEPVALIAAPLPDKEGVLAATYDIPASLLFRKIDRIFQGRGGHLTLAAADGTVIMSSDPSLLLKKAPQPSGNEVTSSSRLSTTDWTLTASYPLREVYAPVDRARLYFFLGLLGATAVAVAFVQLVMGSLTYPLVRFTRHVEEMPEREGEHKLCAIKSGDEIETLSESFNRMVLDLERQREEINRSSELYRSVAYFTSQFAYVRSASGDVGFISPNCERLTGYEDTEFYAYPALLDEIVHPDDREGWQECIIKLHGEDDACSHDLRIVTRDGRTRWISAACVAECGEGESTPVIRGNFTDITERKLAEQALRESKHALEAVVEGAPFAIVALDSELRVTQWNPAAERLFGWSRDEVIGKRYPLIPEGNATDWNFMRDNVRLGRSVSAVPVRRLARNGACIDALLYVTPLRSELNGNGGIAILVAPERQEAAA